MKVKQTKVLKEYIKSKIRKILFEEQASEDKTLADAKKQEYLIKRLPPLKRALETLMGPSFRRYITDISIDAPRPTTFTVTLVNGIPFYLIYSGGKDNPKFDIVNGGFYAQIAGKKYDLNSTSQSQQAMQKISSQLTLSPSSIGSSENEESNPDIGKDAFDSSIGSGGGSFSGGEFPGGGEETGEEGGSLPTPNVVGQAEVPPSLGIPAAPEPGEEEIETPEETETPET